MTSIVNLRCEGLHEPIGIGTATPCLSWELIPSKNGMRTNGCHIRVWNDTVQVWDSSKITGDFTRVAYSGSPLRPRGVYRWQVKVFFSDGSESDWSPAASFECGFFSIADWPGYWIAYSANLMFKEQLTVHHARKEFSLRPGKKLCRARAYVAATGPHQAIGNDAMRMNLYHLRLNGHKVGSDLINPGQLALKRGRALFRVYDVAPLLTSCNAVGLIFAAGKVSVQIFLDYEDGTVDRIGSGPDWRKINRGGPFRRLWKHDIKEYGGRGELYDAGAELTGWDMPDFDDHAWTKVFPCSPPDILSPQTFGVEVYEELVPQTIKRVSNGNISVDFGRNINGMVNLKVKGAAGDKISLRFAETLRPSGEIDSTSTSEVPDFDQEDIYIKKSDVPECYVPTFATHGFRYVEIHGLKETISAEDIRGLAITAKLPNRSFFRSSSDRLNRLHQLCLDTFKANMVSVPTDCAGRERNGWLADAYLVTDAEFLNFDAIHLYRKWFCDIADMQEPDGCLPFVCPFPFPPGSKDIIWAACFTLAVWEAYWNTGNHLLLEESYPAMARLGHYLASFADSPENIGDFIVFGGDHVAAERPTVAFLGYAYCCRNLQLLFRIAAILGKNVEASYFEQKSMMFKNRLNRDFINAAGTYDNGTQSANAHALYFDLVTEERRFTVLAALIAELEEKWKFTSGMMGSHALINALAEHGRNDLIWQLVQQDEPGAWGHWLKTFGATTAPEVWLPENNRKCSWNHPMLIGSLSSWLYRGLGGINQTTAGYINSIIKPFFAPGLNNLSVAVDTAHGLIESSWERNGRNVDLSVVIPVNLHAQVHLPRNDSDAVKINGQNVAPLCSTSEVTIFEIDSGNYVFNFKLNNLPTQH